MTSKFVKPAPGYVIRRGARTVPVEGCVVEWDSFWRRRVNEGGLIVVEPAKSAPKKARKSKTESTEDTEQ
jgi:hypothetical protein